LAPVVGTGGGEPVGAADTEFAVLGAVQNRLTAVDVAARRERFAQDTRTAVVPTVGLALLISVAVLGVTTVGSGNLVGVAAFVSIGALTVVVGAFSRRARARSDAELALVESSLVTADANGIVFQSTTATATLRWAHFTELIETDDLLILRCSAGGGHAIAKRNFESRQAASAFAAELGQHVGTRVESATLPPRSGRRRSRLALGASVLVWVVALLMAGLAVAIFGGILR
jgi:hypothetical protein